MRLVFIYGPPAVGKLSVARELTGLTGFKLFHNHVTVDAVLAVFPFGSPPFSRLLRLYRREMFTEAARAGVDLAFTFVYSSPGDNDLVQEFIEPVQASGGSVQFVQLTCPPEVLLSRVESESRRTHQKLTDPAILRDLLDVHELFAVVPFGDSLLIDTSQISPAGAAAHIVAHYALPMVVRGR